jgi:nucleoid-associated protein YgaU
MKRDAKIGLAVVLVVCVSLAVVYGRQLAGKPRSIDTIIADAGREMSELRSELPEPETSPAAHAASRPSADDAALDAIIDNVSQPAAPPAATVAAAGGSSGGGRPAAPPAGESPEPTAEVPPPTTPAGTSAAPTGAEAPRTSPAGAAAGSSSGAAAPAGGTGTTAAPSDEEILRAIRERPSGTTFAGGPEERVSVDTGPTGAGSGGAGARDPFVRPAERSAEERAAAPAPARETPASASASTGAAAAGEETVYTVASGDSLWKISKKVYGDPKHANRIAKANKLDPDDNLRVGQKLKMPRIEGVTMAAGSAAAAPAHAEAAAETPPAAPAAAGAKTYTVQEGDSLWRIASKELGSGAKYPEIEKLNPGVTSKTVLKVGQKLIIPGK